MDRRHLASLLRDARAAGLQPFIRDGRLVMRGLPAARPIADTLAAYAPEVIALLTFERWTADPRPDLASDSPRWQALLTLAYVRDGPRAEGLFGALHGLRCGGAALVVLGGDVRLCLGELGAEYPALRERYLVPHEEVLRDLLRQLGGRVA